MQLIVIVTKEKTIRKSRITSGGNLDNVLKANEIVETTVVKICQKTGLPGYFFV